MRVLSESRAMAHLSRRWFCFVLCRDLELLCQGCKAGCHDTTEMITSRTWARCRGMESERCRFGSATRAFQRQHGACRLGLASPRESRRRVKQLTMSIYCTVSFLLIISCVIYHWCDSVHLCISRCENAALFDVLIALLVHCISFQCSCCASRG